MKTRKTVGIIALVAMFFMTGCNGSQNGKDDYVDLSLSSSSVSVETGSSTTVNITRGNGDYTVTSSAPAIATANVSNALITINGVAAGTAVVTVTDKGRKEATINVTVTEPPVVAVDLVLSEDALTVNLGGEGFVSIDSGNGGYEATSSDTGIATASINDNYVIIKGVAAGTATVKVTDKGGKEVSISVKVIPVPKGVDMGIGYGWGVQGNHTIVRVPIYHTYAEKRDFTKMEAVTIESLVRFSPFLNWADNDTSNWLNTVIGNPDYFMIRLNHFNGGKARFNAVAGGRELTSVVEAEAEKWYHCALTFNKGKIALYVDGEVQEEAELSGVNTLDLTHSEVPVDQWYDFFLGCYRCSRWLNGCMAEARLWSVARTEEQIKASRTYVDPKTEGLIGYWKLSGTSEEILKDVTGNGFDAEILGEVSFLKENIDVDYAL